MTEEGKPTIYKLFQAWVDGPLEYINIDPKKRFDTNGYVCYACRNKVVGVYELYVDHKKYWVCGSCKVLSKQVLAGLIKMVSPVELYGQPKNDFIAQRPIIRKELLN